MSAQEHNTTADITGEARHDAEQYLTLQLSNEEYGVDILQVQEIKGWGTVTEIPNLPAYIKGVIDLRGTIVPIIDLRIRFGLVNVEYGPTTVVVVLKVTGEQGERIMGIVVDAVLDVYNISNEQAKPTPDFGSVVDTKFVKGLASVNGKLVILLDVNQLIDTGELDEIVTVQH